MPFKHGSAVQLLTIGTDMIKTRFEISEPSILLQDGPVEIRRSKESRLSPVPLKRRTMDVSGPYGPMGDRGCIEIGAGVKRRRARSSELDKREQLPT